MLLNGATFIKFYFSSTTFGFISNLCLLFFCSVEKQLLTVPRTVTCQVLSSDTLAAVTLDACKDDHGEHVRETKASTKKITQIQEPTQGSPPLILAGLHACGDLSVNMLRLVFVKYENMAMECGPFSKLSKRCILNKSSLYPDESL